MLYVTTRNKSDVFTAYHALKKDRCESGGLYVPFQLPEYSKADILTLKDKSFGQCVADVLNQFFSARLDGWDVDFCIGKAPIKLVSMSHKILVAETWHNPDWDFSRLVRNLSGRVLGTEDYNGVASGWTWIAVRIAVLFGLFGEIQRHGGYDLEKGIDIAVSAGDFSAPMAAWYAREMGLPIGNIICGSDDNGDLWNFLHQGQLRTEGNMPENLERLIYGTLGAEECLRFCDVCKAGGIYSPEEEAFQHLRSGMYAAVISQKRTGAVMNNVYRSATYILGPDSALAYGGLQDYRTGTNESRVALILTEKSPVCDCDAVSAALGLTNQDVKERLGVI